MDHEQPHEPEQEPESQDPEAEQDEPGAGSVASPQEQDEQDGDQEDGTKTYEPLRPSPLAGTGWTDAELKSLARQYEELVRRSDLERNAELSRRLGEALDASGVVSRLNVSGALAKSAASVASLITSLYFKPNGDLSRMMNLLGEVSHLAVQQAGFDVDKQAREIVGSALKNIDLNPVLASAMASVALDAQRLIQSAGVQAAIQQLANATFTSASLNTVFEDLDEEAQEELHDLADHLSTEDVSTLAERSLGGVSPDTFAAAYERLAERRDEFTTYEEVEAAAKEVLHEVDPDLDVDAVSDEAVVAQENLFNVLLSLGTPEDQDTFKKTRVREVSGAVGVGTAASGLVLFVLNPALLNVLLVLVAILQFSDYMRRKTAEGMQKQQDQD